MFDWFKKNKNPKFWKHYLALFKHKEKVTFNNCRFVVFDTETTGLSTKTDRILSIGAIAIQQNTLFVNDSFDQFVQQTHFNKNTVEIHGIIKHGSQEKLSEKKAVEEFIKYIGNSVLVAHHAAFDIAMINEALKRMGIKSLKNKTIDTGVLYKKLANSSKKHVSLDSLCKEFNIHPQDRHTAAGDAYITALLFLKIMSRLKKERHVRFEDLFRNSRQRGLL